MLFLRPLVRRWKNSFLLSLVFGLPVMGLMIYMMVMDSQHGEHGGAMPEEQNLLPGLSLLNLVFFLLCTPVQVRGTGDQKGFWCFLSVKMSLRSVFLRVKDEGGLLFLAIVQLIVS